MHQDAHRFDNRKLDPETRARRVAAAKQDGTASTVAAISARVWTVGDQLEGRAARVARQHQRHKAGGFNCDGEAYRVTIAPA